MSCFSCFSPPAKPGKAATLPAHSSERQVANVKSTSSQGGKEAATVDIQCAAATAASSQLPSQKGQMQGTDYDTLSRHLLGVVTTLRNSGAETLLDLPQVVVCGNQSAGKSSVIEAICGINLPRSDGTCTRCPTEVCMIEGPSDTWTATVSVRRSYGLTGLSLQPPEITIIKEHCTQSEVEDAVRNAQTHLLTEGGSLNKDNQLDFTRNTVVVKIQGAPVSLTLVDLPGIVHAIERGARTKPVASSGTPGASTDYPILVENLIRDYGGKDNSVVVAVVSCKEDMETQSILGLVRQLDPKGERTVGVLTKPDTIEKACHQQWFDVLEGKKWNLRLGYYCVKNLNQAELGDKTINHDAARRAEQEFFSQSSDWKRLAKGPAGDRLGTDRLRNALAQVLSVVISRSVPGLLDSAKHQLDEKENEVAALPAALEFVSGPPTGSGRKAGASMAHLVSEVCCAVRSLKAHQMSQPLPRWCGSDGTAEDTSYMLWNALREDFSKFRANVYKSQPAYVVNGKPVSSSEQTIDIQVEDDGVKTADACHTMTLEQVQRLAEDHRALELPGFSPYAAVQALVARSTADWSHEAYDLVTRASRTVESKVLSVLTNRLARFPAAHKVARETAQALLSDMRAAATEQIRALMVMESCNIFTNNLAEFDQLTTAMLHKLRQAETADSNPTSPNVPQNKARARSNNGADRAGPLAAHNNLRDSKASLSSEQLLHMEAVSLAYFTFAARRVVDNVPMHIMYYLVNKYIDKLETDLNCELLGEKDKAALEKLLAEDEDVVHQRKKLVHERDTLKHAVASLNSLKVKVDAWP